MPLDLAQFSTSLNVPTCSTAESCNRSTHSRRSASCGSDVTGFSLIVDGGLVATPDGQPSLVTRERSLLEQGAVVQIRFSHYLLPQVLENPVFLDQLFEYDSPLVPQTIVENHS